MALTSAISVGWHGVGVSVRGDADLLAALPSHLPEFFDGGGEPVLTVTLRRVDGEVRAALPEGLEVALTDEAEALRATASRIELLVADRLPHLVAVHAGVVVVEGRAIVLPGRSRAGKSTLVRALLEAGATYFSDEFALLDRDGLAHPYPRRMTLRTPTGTVRSRPASSALVTDAGVPVGLVAALRFDPAGWEVTDLSAGGAVLALVENCVSIRRSPERAMAALAGTCGEAVRLRGTRGEADDSAGRLIGTLGHRLDDF